MPEGSYEPVVAPPIKLRMYKGRHTKIPKQPWDFLKLHEGCEINIQVIGVTRPQEKPTQPKEAEAPPKPPTEGPTEEASRKRHPDDDIKELKDAGVSDEAIQTLQEIARRRGD